MATPRPSSRAGAKGSKPEAAADVAAKPGMGMAEAVLIMTAITTVAAIVVMDMYAAAAFGKGVFF